ncbi:MAG: hypothetical protein ACE141_09490 [Bryobacteraceae bacterium]
MGFALYLAGDLAWCQGRHEYQPMGASVVSRTDLFRDRDFARFRRLPPPDEACYLGLFASLGEVNAFLRSRRPSRPVTRPRKKPGIR